MSDVLRAIEDQFSIAFPRRVWVFGTVRALRGGGDELEFFLTEASAELTGDTSPRTLPSELDPASFADVDASLRRLHDVAVEDLLVEGHLVRAGGLLSYDVNRHTVVFSVTALDPQPTSAWLDDRRQAVREAVDEARLSERQRDVQVPLAPRRIGVVGLDDDPAVDEVRSLLTGSGFDVDIAEYRVHEKGQRTADGLANAIREAGLGGHDVVLLVREYGRPLALAPYDAENVIRAVAVSPAALVTGLGAPGAPAAVESVAHQAHPTAHEAAEAVVRKLHRASDLVDEARERVTEAGNEALRRAAIRVEQTRSEVIEDLRVAKGKAEAARKKRLLVVRSLAAVLALLIVLVAVLTGVYALLAALIVPVGLGLFSERLRPQRRRGPVSVREMSFATALQRLGDIRRDLQEVADPDVVVSLEQEADELTEHLRTLLRRPRVPRTRETAPPSVPAPGEQASPLFDQFAPGNADSADSADTADATDVGRDDATVSIPALPLATDADDETNPRLRRVTSSDDTTDVSDTTGASADATPTEALDQEERSDSTETPRRTITLPGDAPTAPTATEDDAPTSVLNPPR